MNGYHLTSSVFDKESLRVLLKYDYDSWPLPFIKIACRPDLYWLIGEIPRKIPVYVSGQHDHPGINTGFRGKVYYPDGKDIFMACVPEYPAELSKYQNRCHLWISDHTVGWDLYKKYEPDILEKHVCLEHNDTNPDAGAFAVTPEELEYVL